MYKVYYIIHKQNAIHNNYTNIWLRWFVIQGFVVAWNNYKKQTQPSEELKEDLQRIENDVRDEIDKMKSDEALMTFAEKMQEKFKNDFRETMNAELKMVCDVKYVLTLTIVKVVWCINCYLKY